MPATPTTMPGLAVIGHPVATREVGVELPAEQVAVVALEGLLVLAGDLEMDHLPDVFRHRSISFSRAEDTVASVTLRTNDERDRAEFDSCPWRP